MTTLPQAQEAGVALLAAEKALAMALQHIRICAPDPTVETALEAIDLKALATPARVVSEASEVTDEMEELLRAYEREAIRHGRTGENAIAVDEAAAKVKAALSTLQSGAEGKDGERMDWLEANCSSFTWDAYGGTEIVHRDEGPQRWGWRNRIDQVAAGEKNAALQPGQEGS